MRGRENKWERAPCLSGRLGASGPQTTRGSARGCLRAACAAWTATKRAAEPGHHGRGFSAWAGGRSPLGHVPASGLWEGHGSSEVALDQRASRPVPLPASPPALPCRAALPSPRGAPPGLPLRRRMGPWAKPTFCCERRAALPTRFLRAPSQRSQPQRTAGPRGVCAWGPQGRTRGPRGRAQGTASLPPGSRTDAAWRCLRCPGHRRRGDGREGTRVVGMSGGSRLYGKPAVGCSSQNQPTPLMNTSRGKRGRDGKSILSGALFLP